MIQIFYFSLLSVPPLNKLFIQNIAMSKFSQFLKTLNVCFMHFQVECQQCSYCSNKFDPFLDLSLEIAKADTLPVALRNFTAAEVLDGGEKQYQCQRCKQKVRAKKRLTVHKAPHVLTIHLKRFHAHDPGRKVDKKVIFDRSLDIKPFVSGSYVSMRIIVVNFHSSRLDEISFLVYMIPFQINSLSLSLSLAVFVI